MFLHFFNIIVNIFQAQQWENLPGVGQRGRPHSCDLHGERGQHEEGLWAFLQGSARGEVMYVNVCGSQSLLKPHKPPLFIQQRCCSCVYCNSEQCPLWTYSCKQVVLPDVCNYVCGCSLLLILKGNCKYSLFVLAMFSIVLVQQITPSIILTRHFPSGWETNSGEGLGIHVERTSWLHSHLSVKPGHRATSWRPCYSSSPQQGPCSKNH